MNKFNRKYLLAIQYGEVEYTEKEKDENGKDRNVRKFKSGDKEMIIRPFFTVKINIDRGIYSTINKFSIDIYNLAKNTRENIYYDSILHAALYKKIVFYAGYSDKDFSNFNEPVITDKIRSSINGLPLVFCGKFTRAYSYRQGSNMITHIEGFDLPEKNEVKLEAEFKKDDGVDKIKEVIENNFGISKESIKISPDFDFKFQKNMTFKGNCWNILEDIVKTKNLELKKQNKDNTSLFRLYFDYPNILIQKDDEYSAEEYTLINAQTGLLDTPIREGAKVTFKTLFEPFFRCGGYIKLDSRTTQTGINGIFKVIGFKHNGTISPVESGTLTTEFTCFLGIDKLKAM